MQAQPFSTVQVGLGGRGIAHVDSLLKYPELFRVVGLCNRSPEKLKDAKARYGFSEDACYSDARQMLEEVRPEILSFSTMPHDRLELVQLAAEFGVRGILMEKPIATSLREAGEILRISKGTGMRVAVCHQHKYLRSFLRLKEVLDSGDLGEIYRIDAQCQQHASQIASHYIDYILWAAGAAKPIAVNGHVHGNFYLEDAHPSPDYIFGDIIFDNGLRGTIQCGYASPKHQEHDNSFDHGPKTAEYYTDNRLTVYGTKGYAFAECNGRFAAFHSKTNGQVEVENFGTWAGGEKFKAQDLYTRDFGLWMAGEMADHPCSLEKAFSGYQVLEALYLSALEFRRVDLPLPEEPREDSLERFKRILPPVNYRDLQ